MPRHVILIQCPDEKGLIARVTQEIFARELNIISNGEFVDPRSRTFYMRTEVEGETGSETLSQALKGCLPKTAGIRVNARTRTRLGVLVSKEAHCLGDLLVNCAFGDLGAEIAVILSNHDSLKGLAKNFSIPFHHVSHEGCTREEHERKVLEILSTYSLDYLVLAKYMRVLTPGFLKAYPERIVNIHHSFLPAFIGARPYLQAYERGVKIIGATAHYVTEDLDEGPIIAQAVIPVDHTHSSRDMALAGRDVEKSVLSKALRLVVEERVFVSGKRTVVFE